MMIRVYTQFKAGERVAIELKQGQTVAGKIRWTRGDSVGVSFDQPIDVVSLVSTSMQGPRPRMPRIEVSCTAWVREDGTIHRTRALNVSQGGVKVACPAGLTLGADVTVTLNGLAPVAGVVRWCEDKSYGITFNRALALPALVGWLHGQQQRARAAG
jgi:hypothetical protein